MIKVTIGKEAIQFPTKWEEVTYSQYVKILESKSQAQLVCILLGKDWEEMKNVKVLGLEDLFTAAAFTTTIPQFDVYYPKVGPYSLPSNNQHNKQFDIRFESLGQFEDMRQVMTGIKPDDTTGLMKAYGKAVAIYLQKIRDKEYDPAKVPELEDELQGFKACEVMAMGQFFFLKLILLSNGTPKTSPHTPPTPKKSRPALKSSRKSSGRMRR